MLGLLFFFFLIKNPGFLWIFWPILSIFLRTTHLILLILVRACRISLSSHAAGSEQSEHPLLDAVVPPHSLFFGGHAWQGAGTSGAPAPSPPSPHPLPASLTVSPELSPRRGLHSFGWRQALGASQISAPPTSPPPLLCFFLFWQEWADFPSLSFMREKEAAPD